LRDLGVQKLETKKINTFETKFRILKINRSIL